MFIVAELSRRRNRYVAAAFGRSHFQPFLEIIYEGPQAYASRGYGVEPGPRRIDEMRSDRLAIDQLAQFRARFVAGVARRGVPLLRKCKLPLEVVAVGAFGMRRAVIEMRGSSFLSERAYG